MAGPLPGSSQPGNSPKTSAPAAPSMPLCASCVSIRCTRYGRSPTSSSSSTAPRGMSKAHGVPRSDDQLRQRAAHDRTRGLTRRPSPRAPLARAFPSARVTTPPARTTPRRRPPAPPRTGPRPSAHARTRRRVRRTSTRATCDVAIANQQLRPGSHQLRIEERKQLLAAVPAPHREQCSHRRVSPRLMKDAGASLRWAGFEPAARREWPGRTPARTPAGAAPRRQRRGLAV